MSSGDPVADGGETVVNGMPEGLVLVPSPPRLAEYQQLRDAAGLPARTDAQATAELRVSWAFGHVRAGSGRWRWAG